MQKRRICPKCKKQRWRSDFVTEDPLELCKLCKAPKPRKRAKKWGWENALHRETGQRLGQSKEYYNNMGYGISGADVIRALAICQENACMLTGNLFYYPDATIKFTAGNTLEKWRKSLPPALRQRTPALVRIFSNDAWNNTNVILIAYWLRYAYEESNGLLDFRNKCKLISIRTPAIVQKQEIVKTMFELAQKRKKEGKQ